MIFKWVLAGTFVASYIGEDGDKINHLFEWIDQNRVVHHVAFRYEKEVKPESVRTIKVECNEAWGVDEAASDLTNTWVTYRGYICNGYEVIMSDGKTVVVDEELKKEIEEKKEEPKSYDFEAEMRKNAEKKKKAAEERRKANKSVLKSYRIK